MGALWVLTELYYTQHTDSNNCYHGNTPVHTCTCKCIFNSSVHVYTCMSLIIHVYQIWSYSIY